MVNGNNRLKDLRLEFGYTLENVGDYLDVNKSTAMKIQNGVFRLQNDKIKKLCELYQVTSDYLIGESDFGIIVHSEFGFCTISKAQFDKYVKEDKIFYTNKTRNIARSEYVKLIRACNNKPLLITKSKTTLGGGFNTISIDAGDLIDAVCNLDFNSFEELIQWLSLDTKVGD